MKENINQELSFSSKKNIHKNTYINSNEKQNKKRKLSEDISTKRVNDICENASDELINYYKGEDVDLDIDWEYEYNKENNIRIERLLKIFEGEDKKENEKEYLLGLTFPLIFLILSVLTLLSFIFFCIFTFKKKELNKNSNLNSNVDITPIQDKTLDEQQTHTLLISCCPCFKTYQCKLISFLLSFISNIIILVGSIYLLTQEKPLLRAPKDTKCAAAHFGSEARYGRTTGERPWWTGTDETRKIFEGIKKSIIESRPYFSILSPKHSTLSSHISQFNAFTNNNYDLNQRLAFEFPEAQHTTAYFAETAEFEDFKNKLKALEIGIDEFSRPIFTQLKEEAEIIFDMENADESNERINQSLNDFDNDIQTFIDSLFTYIDNYYGKIDSYATLILPITTIVTLSADVLCVVVLIILALISEHKGKFYCVISVIVNILWIILLILSFLWFLIGCIFMTIGKFGEDSGDLISFLFSSSNLQSSSPYFFPKSTADSSHSILNTCTYISSSNEIIDNSDKLSMIHALGLDSGFLASLASLARTSTASNSYVADIEIMDAEKNDCDKKIKDLKKKCDYESDTYIVSSRILTSYTLQHILAELNKCTENRHRWSLIPCLVYDTMCKQVTEDTVTPYMDQNDLSSCAGKTYSDVGVSFFSQLRPIIRDLKRQCNEMVTDNAADADKGLYYYYNKIKRLYTNVYNAIIEIFRSYQDLTSKLTADFEPVKNSKNPELYAFLNCKFIRGNLLIMINQFNDKLGKKYVMASAFMVSMAFGLYILVFSITTIMNINIEGVHSEEENDEATKRKKSIIISNIENTNDDNNNKSNNKNIYNNVNLKNRRGGFLIQSKENKIMKYQSNLNKTSLDTGETEMGLLSSNRITSNNRYNANDIKTEENKNISISAYKSIKSIMRHKNFINEIGNEKSVKFNKIQINDENNNMRKKYFLDKCNRSKTINRILINKPNIKQTSWNSKDEGDVSFNPNPILDLMPKKSKNQLSKSSKNIYRIKKSKISKNLIEDNAKSQKVEQTNIDNIYDNILNNIDDDNETIKRSKSFKNKFNIGIYRRGGMIFQPIQKTNNEFTHENSGRGNNNNNVFEKNDEDKRSNKSDTKIRRDGLILDLSLNIIE